MRIAMMTNNYKPFIGGVPISIERLAEGLREIGHEVFIFAPSYENNNCSEEKYIVRCKSFKKKKGEYIIPNILKSNIEEHFKNLHIELIHVHHPIIMGNLAQYLGKKYNIPVVFTYHTKYEEYLHNISIYNIIEKRIKKEEYNLLINMEKKLLGFVKRKVVPTYLKIFMNNCDMIFAPTGEIKEYLQSSNVKSEVNIIPTGLSKDYFKENIYTTTKIRKKYGENKKYIFCTVCRLNKEKNLEFLIKGIHNLKERIGDCFNVMIIGDGPFRDKLETMALELNLQNNIKFINNVDNNEIGNYYRASDIFLFSSKSETQGIVLLEAMAAKVPVVAIKGTGVSDIVQNGINGYMTEENIEEWAKRVEILVQNEKLRKKLGDGAFRTSISYLNTNIAEATEEQYGYAMGNYLNKKEKKLNINNIYGMMRQKYERII